ncbi:diguanylate cyclase [Vescimonas sp.]|uniref:diguanylate cyclase n=1 Tax=Vescimonas sp. TaxID=2892404 RepID=UPI00307B3974
MEKLQLIQSLKHWCDLIWEYNQTIGKIYVYRDKLAIKLENNWYDPAELDRIIRQEYRFEVSRSDSFFSADSVPEMVQKNTRLQEFDLWFCQKNRDLIWYNMRMEKLNQDSWIITGYNKSTEMKERSMYRALRNSFESILSTDVNTRRYLVNYSTFPVPDRLQEYDYDSSVSDYVRKYVYDEDKEQIIRALSLDTVMEKLQTQEDYSVFITVRQRDGSLSYKRVIHNYYDDTHQRITTSRLDISAIVNRYEAKIAEIRRENSIDALTGVYNRNYYEKNIRGTSLQGFVAMLDLDNLKLCNDHFGHSAGDSVLKKLAEVIKAELRSGDKLIRFGGDEFLLLAQDCPDDEFEQLLLRIQTKVSEAAVPGFPGLSLSVSIGGTRVAGSSSSEAVMRADQMMYMAKAHKNLVITDRFMLQNGKDGIARLEKEQVLQQILIVDDSDMNRAMLREILKDNYSILEAGNGVECLSCVEHMGPSLSLILLDLNMPEMDGFEVLAELSRLGYMDDIPVIIISGTDSTADICRAYDLGATDYIHRPFNTQVIYRRVSNTITLMAKQRRMAELVNRQIDRTTKQQELMVDFLSRIIGYRSGESNPHFANISTLSALLLQALQKRKNHYGLTERDCQLIATAAVFHDVGKIGIPESILLKPGKLTAKEFEVMKTHTLIGDNLIKSLEIYHDEPLLQMAAQICRWHHERYDGGGYPDGLKGEEIPICAQVVSIADAYDALMGARPYKPAFSSEKAIQMILNGECGVFNPVLVDCLLEVVSQQKTGKEGTPPPKNLSTVPGGSVLNTPIFSGSVM